MILFNFFIAIFAIFISPHVFIYYRFQNIKYSLVIIYSFILSFTTIWIITLLSYYLNIPNSIIYYLATIIAVSSIIYMLKKQNIVKNNQKYNFIIWVLAIILLIPIFKYAGTGFTEWDSVVSWNRWGLELYNNIYHPIDAAYPLLIPSLYSIVYKIQGTNNIWWTAKIALFYLPLITLVLPLVLYKEYKNLAFIFIAILIYPYLLMDYTILGTVDMPVMIMGMLTLITMYAAEINKGNRDFEYYAYASLILAGIASITKQSGLAFILFDIIYVLLNLSYFQNKRKLLFFLILSSLYFLTFLSMYYINAVAGVTGNIDWLKSLSAKNFSDKVRLWYLFFSYPPNLSILKPVEKLFDLPRLMPYFMGFGVLVFLLVKDARKYNSISLLSFIFLIGGFFAWGKYASYHPRNSWWDHTFLIMFVSVNLHHFILWYQKKKIPPTLIYFLLILLTGIYFLTLDDKFADKKQRQFQTKLGRKYLIKEVVNLVHSKDKCLKIYTNDYMLHYNYYARGIQDRIISGGVDEDFLHKGIENQCKDGSYIVFRVATHKFPIWRKISKAIKEKKIIPNKKFGDIFYVKPYTTLPKDYFVDKTAFVKMKLINTDSNIRYKIDYITDFDTYYQVYAWAFIRDAQKDETQKYIVLTRNNETYIIATEEVRRVDVATNYKRKGLDTSGFQANIFKKDFKKGKYDISVLLIDKNKKQHIIKTEKSIIIKADTHEKDNPYGK